MFSVLKTSKVFTKIAQTWQRRRWNVRLLHLLLQRLLVAVDIDDALARPATFTLHLHSAYATCTPLLSPHYFLNRITISPELGQQEQRVLRLRQPEEGGEADEDERAEAEHDDVRLAQPEAHLTARVLLVCALPHANRVFMPRACKSSSSRRCSGKHGKERIQTRRFSKF